MKLSALRISLSLLFLFVIGSCGEQLGGGGGGGGAKETGIYLNVDSIAPRDEIPGKDTTRIDMTWNTDCSNDGSTTTDDIEKFGDHTATVTLSAARVPGATDSPAAGNWIQINRYTVEYTVSQGYSGPSFSNKEYTASVKTSVDGTASITAELMPVELKKTYVSSLGGTLTWSYGYPLYTVTYTFYGEDDRGRDVWARGFVTVEIGGFNNCS